MRHTNYQNDLTKDTRTHIQIVDVDMVEFRTQYKGPHIDQITPRVVQGLECYSQKVIQTAQKKGNIQEWSYTTGRKLEAIQYT